MSRIGKKPIVVPNDVKVEFGNNIVTVSGNNKKLTYTLPSSLIIKFENNNKLIKILCDDNFSEKTNINAMQGLARSLINNMIIGIDKGFIKKLEIHGVGYRAKVDNGFLELLLGYSHPIRYKIPSDVEITVKDNVKISITGIDKQLVGEVAAIIRKFRKPDSYKGKGIRYTDEYIKLKEGKKAGSK